MNHGQIHFSRLSFLNKQTNTCHSFLFPTRRSYIRHIRQRPGVEGIKLEPSHFGTDRRKRLRHSSKLARERRNRKKG